MFNRKQRPPLSGTSLLFALEVLNAGTVTITVMLKRKQCATSLFFVWSETQSTKLKPHFRVYVLDLQAQSRAQIPRHVFFVALDVCWAQERWDWELRRENRATARDS